MTGPPGHARRSPGLDSRAPARSVSADDSSSGYHPAETLGSVLTTTEPYAGPSRTHGPVGYVYEQRIAAKAKTATVDLEAAFYELVDELGDDRCRALLFRRKCTR